MMPSFISRALNLCVKNSRRLANGRLHDPHGLFRPAGLFNPTGPELGRLTVISDEEIVNPFLQANRVDCHGRQTIAVFTAVLDLELGLAIDFSDGTDDRRSPAIVEVEPVTAILTRSIEA
jgi:hypothetical protein